MDSGALGKIIYLLALSVEWGTWSMSFKVPLQIYYPEYVNNSMEIEYY